MYRFKEEYSIASELWANNSIAWYSQASKSETLPERIVKHAQANIGGVNFKTPDTDDLYYTRSILVSTSANFNGDHFHPLETWAARHTPIDKPTNIDHDQGVIIGHITSQWVIDAQGNLVADDIPAEEIPEFYHIANGGVIYRKFPRNPELQEKSDFLVAQIEEGDMFVSMECTFTNFQYAVSEGENNYLVPRNEESSFLTKHLRAYGGTGEFEGMKISRSLMNINFTGKGYVEEPANKDSIIFAKDKVSRFSFANLRSENPFSRTNGVQVSCKADIGENIMADNQDRIKELEATVASLNEKLAEAGSKALNSKIEALENELAEAVANSNELQEQLEKEQTAKACMCGQVQELVEERDALKAELEKEAAKRVLAERVKALTDKGYSQEEAKAEVEVLKSLDDDTFAIVVKRFEDKTQAEAENLAPKSKELESSNAEVEIEKEEEKEEKAEASVETEDTEMTARANRIKAIAAQFSTNKEEK